jgi:DNA-binding transcriptional MerR regulator
MMGEFTIGQLSSSAGVSRYAIRYYERMKLLPQAVRSQSGYRLYSEADLERLRFIKRPAH